MSNESLVKEPGDCDVLVVGGGVNGSGIARDLAGRGHRVLLCERDDLAAHTSSASTKLVHGGLRYLEHREFRLVRHALQEREVLLRSAPHIMRAMRFVVPLAPGARPAWLVRAGLFLYDHLAPRGILPPTQSIDLRGDELGAALAAGLTHAFVYSDGWVDDARLVVLNAIDAKERGATVLTRTECVQASAHAQGWVARLREAGGAQREVRARALVNATGPWADSWLGDCVRDAHGAPLHSRPLRLVKGSHIVVPRRFSHDHGYLFQNLDGRVIFALPYEREFTLIGTTELEFTGDARGVRIEPGEIDYLCQQASRWLREPVRPHDVRWTYSGVRPLIEDEPGSAASAVTRDYALQLREVEGAPLLNVWGGKITTYRRLSEEAADEISARLGERRAAWTRTASLPGGDLREWATSPSRPDEDFARFLAAAARRWPWLDAGLLQRYARSYGTRMERVLADARDAGDLGAQVAPGLHEAELEYLVREEWARTSEDVLWRRSKLGLHIDAAQAREVASWMGQPRSPLLSESARSGGRGES
ncbi:MAG TPA: glycerol-3-phosphate dehydrogenase [Burkholderiaceae bacterium]|nr:glycerol-3-phosphate dehydrogenase [Burkholderiaceae bacterium]